MKAVGHRIREVLPRFPEIAAAYLFGSALGECQPDSDIDLALIVPPSVEEQPSFSPWGLEGLVEAALGPLGGHGYHPTVLARRRPVFAMEALGGHLLYCADEEALADFIEAVARRFPDAERHWLQAVEDVLAAGADRLGAGEGADAHPDPVSEGRWGLDP